ncbi:helix-turn-helix transcriptional regulator [Streptomyces sp. ME19-01-6]|uniref:helix-turn-helix domain-containing protein n=1 Tax=Streptomyces sp. ME19-01-6 TaxID=3028686 RepID=UPI0029AC1149|nr:helix-turn-helix transcriptional regulator [Streptomyces sp. ME19-01-6]MDX3228318.1 helix-turn-helix transcriptional regulator [Streptomyces sp. ME19-01-6]
MGQRRSDTPEAPRQAAAALTSSAGRRLAAELRRIKQASGLSFARLEARTHYSRASLERYVNGKLFPSRDAVEDVAQACGADTRLLLKLWDDALEAGAQPPPDTASGTAPPDMAPSPETTASREAATFSDPTASPEATASPSGRPGRGRAPRGARRRLLLFAGLGLVCLLSLGLALLPFSPLSPFGSEPASKAPTTGCRDYDADMRAYAVGTICWSSARATVTGYVKNPDGTGKAVVQLCISNQPNVCSQTMELAVAGPGGTSRYRRTVTLPAGHGVWIRTCAEDLCTQWD